MAFCVYGLFLLLDFYFVTFFEGGGNFPREMERKEQMEQRQSPADDRVDIWSCTPEEREWIIGLALVFFVPLLGLVLWRDWDKIIGLDRDGLIELAISIGHVGIFAVVFAFLVIQGVGMKSLLVEKYRERQDRKLRDGIKENNAQWRSWLEKKYPGDPLPPFADDDTGNDRQQ